MKWRLIVDEGSVYWCMAVDEAILEAHRRGVAPCTLRLYTITPSAVTIGYFQRITEAVDVDYASSAGIPVVRRVTGGGAVYHDARGEVTYSVVAPISAFPGDVEDSFHSICMGIVYALEELGLEAEISGVNDVTVGARKISGSAQLRRGHALLQHGTLLYATDLSVMARVLKPPKAKLAAHGVSSITERVTTVARELGTPISKSRVLAALKKGFSKALGVDFYIDRLSGVELSLARSLEEKYRSREWNFMR